MATTGDPCLTVVHSEQISSLVIIEDLEPKYGHFLWKNRAPKSPILGFSWSRVYVPNSGGL